MPGGTRRRSTWPSSSTAVEATLARACRGCASQPAAIPITRSTTTTRWRPSCANGWPTRARLRWGRSAWTPTTISRRATTSARRSAASCAWRRSAACPSSCMCARLTTRRWPSCATRASPRRERCCTASTWIGTCSSHGSRQVATWHSADRSRSRRATTPARLPPVCRQTACSPKRTRPT